MLVIVLVVERCENGDVPLVGGGGGETVEKNGNNRVFFQPINR